MTTAATSLLGLALPVTGELAGTWGDTVNNSITSLLDTAVAGTTTLSTDADVTLTTTELSSNQARQAILLWTAGGTATRTITAPAKSKIYTVINASSSTQSIKLVGVGPTTGVTIVKGEAAICAWNGSDFIKVSNTSGAGAFTDLTVTGNTVLGDADTDTLTFGASFVTGTTLKSAKLANNTLALAAYDVDGTAYTNLVTLTAGNTPSLALTSTAVGTINNMSIGATTASTGAFTTLSASSDVTLSGGTANGVLYLNGSKVATSGSALVFDGTNLGIGISPSAWTNGPAIQAAGFGLQSFSSTLMLLHQNSYYNSGTGYIYRTTAAASMYAQTGGQHQWYNAPSGTAGNAITYTQAMTLDASGNLGIGTSSPAVKLDVAGAVGFGRFTSTTGTNHSGIEVKNGSSYLDFGIDNSTGGNYGFGAYGRGIYSDGAYPFIFNINGANRLTIDSSGNLGLGVTPSAWNNSIKALQINNTSYASFTSGNNMQNWIALNAYYDNATGWLYKNSSVGSALYSQVYDGSHTWKIAASGTAGNAISFTQAMTLDASGNLGIGTSSPTQPLSIAKGSGVAAYLDVAGGGRTLGTTSFTFGQASDGVVAFFQRENAAMYWATNATERMRLDSSGNLGLGVTPSAWTGLYGTKAFDVGAYGSFVGSNSDTLVANNAFYDGVWKYKNSNSASYYQQVSGQNAWYTAPSGTAGNAITFTQAMTLAASGNLLIGTTTESGSGRLRVVDSVRIADSTTETNALLITTSGTTATIETRYAKPIVFGTDGTERARIDSSGNLIQSAPSTAPTLSTNGTMVFNLTSNTNLRVSVRGSDGVTRTANITLA